MIVKQLPNGFTSLQWYFCFTLKGFEIFLFLEFGSSAGRRSIYGVHQPHNSLSYFIRPTSPLGSIAQTGGHCKLQQELHFVLQLARVFRFTASTKEHALLKGMNSL